MKKDTAKFSKVIISLASPDAIKDRSYGEVKKPETINYRSLRPEPDGLFCERIFGPVKDYECACGKYKRIRYKGIICDRCKVEVTEKKVRRERTGHIELMVPVVHIWYFRTTPSKIAILLGYKQKEVEQIVYYERYVVINPGPFEKELSKGDLLTEDEYKSFWNRQPKELKELDDSDPQKFVAKMGAEALEALLRDLNLDELALELRERIANETSQQRRQDLVKRLKYIETFREANKRIENRPEWMVVRIVPVIPPELRPIIFLDGGRPASSDLNDLYRRVIIRNNRLKRLMSIKAPDVILRNEKRMLQEAVDALFDNSRKQNAVRASNNRQLKSLTDTIKGKQGRFRQNLLGKRVDYSGRSVIVVGPELKLHECGLPKEMAAELFKPFIIRRLIERGVVRTVKSAKRIIERKENVVWEILEQILKGHPVLLNRAPTLHRLGIQAFQPKLIEGKAIQLHPLVCIGFNADFDGDQMAVHVPLSHTACLEAMILMLSSHNILHPANGKPIVLPSQDMVLGLYYLTKERPNQKGEGKIFYSPEDVRIAYDQGKVALHAKIKVRIPKWDKEKQAYEIDEETGAIRHEIIETTVGRVLFNEIVPKEVGFINELLTKKRLRNVIHEVYKLCGTRRTAEFLDKIKELGFYLAFKGGLSFRISDILIPKEKQKMIEKAKEQIDEINEGYAMGAITESERYNQVVEVWGNVRNKLANKLMAQLQKDQEGFNPIFMMLDSGARGSREQILQLGGMRGLMAKPQKSAKGGIGEVIENPILSNFKEGLSVIEYFISTHGARKGLTDTALKTADAGYLTRRLVDVAQDVVVTEEDCGTLRGIVVQSLEDEEQPVSLSAQIIGRIALKPIVHPETGEVLCDAGELITEEKALAIEKAGIESVEVRSVLTCDASRGVCAKCYGLNLATGHLVEVGEAVGVMAGQSIGEPGTQLTLRTFHSGGTAGSATTDKEVRTRFKGKVVFDNVEIVEKEVDGEIQKIVLSRGAQIHIVSPATEQIIRSYDVPYAATLKVEDGQLVEKGTVLFEWIPYYTVILSDVDGEVAFHEIIEGVTCRKETDPATGLTETIIIPARGASRNPAIHIINPDTGEIIKEYNIPVNARLVVQEGQKIARGDVLVKIPRTIGRIGDITGGLPRVQELFEARNPSNPAIISEIDGIVQMGRKRRTKQEVIVTTRDGSETRKYQIPLTRHILVRDNDFVRAGQPLCDGMISPQDILRVKGVAAVQNYIVNEVQKVYRKQGVEIDNKHIEVIVRQMMQKVRILDPGDSIFLEGEEVSRKEFFAENEFLYGKKFVVDPGDSTKFRRGMIVDVQALEEENERLKAQGLKLVQVRDAIPAVAEPILQGITRAALTTDSWISAASFQETPRVLSEAAIAAKEDSLQGLKENVIVGHLIPAGTGLRRYEGIEVGTQEELEKAVEESLKKEFYIPTPKEHKLT